MWSSNKIKIKMKTDKDIKKNLNITLFRSRAEVVQISVMMKTDKIINIVAKKRNKTKKLIKVLFIFIYFIFLLKKQKKGDHNTKNSEIKK